MTPTGPVSNRYRMSSTIPGRFETQLQGMDWGQLS